MADSSGDDGFCVGGGISNDFAVFDIDPVAHLILPGVSGVARDYDDALTYRFAGHDFA